MVEASPSTRKHCQSLTRAGEPCQSFALPDSRFCFSHDPERAEQRLAAREKGGRNRSNLQRAKASAPARLLPVYDALEAALEDVLAGSLPPARATAAATIGRALVSLLQAGELEEKVRRLEAIIEKDQT